MNTARVTLIALTAAATFLLAACTELDSGRKEERTVVVTMSSSDSFSVDGKHTQRKGLEKALKSAGADAGTPVVISIPESTPEAEMSALAKQLAGAGFRRIMFTRPKKVVTTSEAP